MYDSSSGTHITTLAAGQPGSFTAAGGTVSDRWGNLLVADRTGGCVVVLDPNGRVTCRIGGAQGGAGPGELGYVCGVSLAGEGDLLVCRWGEDFGEDAKIFQYTVPKT